jgi:hypothetical protein
MGLGRVCVGLGDWPAPPGWVEFIPVGLAGLGRVH